MEKNKTAIKKVVISTTFATGLVFAAPYVTEAALGDQTLREGMNHSDVQELQEQLASKGFFTYHTTTDYYGTITVDAVKKFQRDNNLSVDGIAGPKTFAALLNTSSSSSSSASSNQSSSSVSSGTILRNGSRGSAVTNLQKELKDLGYYTIAVDGIYGSGTTSAVRAFQRDNNLSADGIAGPKTFAALNNGPSSNSGSNSNSDSSSNSGSNSSSADKDSSSSSDNSGTTLRNGSRGSAVTNLQKELKDLGYYTIAVDGIYGSGTTSAVRAFQRENNLTVDGIAGPNTFAALNGSPNSNSNSGSNSNSDSSSSGSNSGSSSSSILRVGSTGDAVTGLQDKLRSLGFFSSNSTGLYGENTAEAVRNFQRANGLQVDGIAGPNTFSKLDGLATNKPSGSNSGSSNAGSGNNSGGSSGSGAMITNLIAEASLHIGVPYVWGGTTTSGFDCSGYVQYVFKQQNVSIPRTVAQQWDAGTSVSSPSVGDVVFFATTSSAPSHNGIYIGNNQFIHSGTSTGVTIADLDNSYWSPRYLGAKKVH